MELSYVSGWANNLVCPDCQQALPERMRGVSDPATGDAETPMKTAKYKSPASVKPSPSSNPSAQGMDRAAPEIPMKHNGVGGLICNGCGQRIPFYMQSLYKGGPGSPTYKGILPLKVIGK